MSYDLLKESTNDLKGDQVYVEKELLAGNGTTYPSYWFYKLEYLLWKNRAQFDKKSSWETYKMTAKNSIEHISPQHPKAEDTNVVFSNTDGEKDKRDKQNDFGNLVLLSPGMNSEYSNKTYNVKRTEFKDKKRLDSLKSDLIFDNDKWNWDLCVQHRDKMISQFKDHLNMK